MSKNLALPNNLPVISNAGSLSAYVQAVNAIPLLSVEEEKRLAMAYWKENDLEAAKTIILAHLRYVVRLAYGYRGYKLPMADLIQEGNIGLMQALKRFNPSRGVRFVSFAAYWIRSQINEYVIRNWRMVKIATTKAQRKLFFNLRKTRKSLGYMSEEEVAEMAKKLDLKISDVRKMEHYFNSPDISFDVPEIEDEDDNCLTPSHYLAAPDSDHASVFIKEDHEKKNIQALKVALCELPERERNIIQRRWLAKGKGASLRELAEKYGISIERVRQLESNAMKKMRKHISACVPC